MPSRDRRPAGLRQILVMLRHTASELQSTAVPATLLSFAVLRATGAPRRRIDDAVRTGRLIRVRKGRYVLPDLSPELVVAARLGGRLDCVSLLRLLEVFVLDRDRLHVQFDSGSSRLPPHGRVRAHWRVSAAPGDAIAADLIEALAQACRCQSPRAAIATLDSAWHLGLVDEDQLSEVFALLPRRYLVLRAHLDRRAESGPETLMRLLLRQLGCHVQVQVTIDGVGRVDLVVDGWLIIECDSEEYHADWESQKRDRRRDLAAAALGYTTLRPIAEDIMYHSDEVLTRVRSVLAARAVLVGERNSSKSGRRSPARAPSGAVGRRA